MIKKFFCALFLLFLTTHDGRSASIELSFPDSLSWKAIFDDGFRPKHVPGLQTVMAECQDQELTFKFRQKSGFPLDRGRLMFELQSDDSLRIIEHVSRVPISLAEGEKRMTAFHALFDKELKRRGSVPPVMDPKRNSMMATSDYYAAAETDGYTIHYGFTSSFQKNTPLIPVFMIALRHNMKAVQLPVRMNIVEPPPGYEWYSMDPMVHTPAPGVKPEPVAVTQPSARQQILLQSRETAGFSEQTNPGVKKTAWLWWAGLGVVLLIAAGVLARGLRCSNKR